VCQQLVQERHSQQSNSQPLELQANALTITPPVDSRKSRELPRSGYGRTDGGDEGGWTCVQVEPCCWMTYTRHRDTRETLQILDRLDLDSDKPTEEEIMAKFGFDEQFRAAQLTCWQRVRPKIWLLFEEPNSTLAAKVCCRRSPSHCNQIKAYARHVDRLNAP